MTAGAKEHVSSEELDDIASRFSAVPDELARSIYEDGKAESAIEDEPKDDVELEAHTDPVRPKSVHWKKWANFTVEEKLAAVEAAKAETPELATI